jgi:hypothetical protein
MKTNIFLQPQKPSFDIVLKDWIAMINSCSASCWRGHILNTTAIPSIDDGIIDPLAPIKFLSK